MDRKNIPMVECPKCHGTSPAGTDICPNCGKRLPVKWGYLSDAQIKRIRKPISIVVWTALALFIIWKYFISKQP